ncbi:MAG: hypothetical protein OXF62_04630 [Caldilineaceae bacterium]|nr:hypothetical protein [Caldilineaceae bacterium]MCY4090083.1 hypothetical protein [Caldilineaceae bacterium]MCY4115454.1 hypothetical protein [Caldilineaceae bacterium]MDE0070410.1 hypothetical protein [Caldilineaceae bacterium]MDE0180084.1 hypothetical protein [Caldilineaceae bacterium]
MARIDEDIEFQSWLVALRTGILNEMQLQMLQLLIDEGKAKDLEGAARYLDWRNSVMDPTEHFYGH